VAVRHEIDDIGFIRVIDEAEIVLQNEKGRVGVDQPEVIEKWEKESGRRKKVALHVMLALV
jgi:hypothetical protein